MTIDQQRLRELEQAFQLFNETSLHLAEEFGRVQKALHITSRRLAELLTLLPVASIMLDAGGRVTDLNPAAREIFGAVKGACWEEVSARVFVQRTVAGELVTEDGRVFQPSETTLEPDGTRILLLQDVTAARQLQAHQSRHQRLSSMGEMAASLAHQIRTPLSTALLYVSQMDQEMTAEQRRQFIERTLASLRHIEGLIKDMLQYAQGGRRTDLPVNLQTLLASLEQAVQPIMSATDSRLTLEVPETPVIVLGDRDALLTALQNLVNNAVEVVGQGAQVTIRLWREAEWACIEVRDNGPGIEPALQEKIFEPFFTRRAQGTGLGLAVVRAVVEAHNGDVTLTSRPMQGAVFTIRLPLANREDVQ